MDWSRSIRLSGAEQYLLIGPQDSTRSGHLVDTWGGPSFASRGRPCATPPWGAAWVREDLPQLSRLVLGSEDAPGRVGTMGVVAFRRLTSALQLKRLRGLEGGAWEATCGGRGTPRRLAVGSWELDRS